MVIGPNDYTASIALDGFEMDVKVEERNDKMDLSCWRFRGKETFEIPSVRIRLDEVLLIRFADTTPPEGKDSTSGRILILVQMTVEGMDL